MHKPVIDEIHVVSTGHREWSVEGRAARRAARFSDLTNDEALAEITKRLKSLGVDRMLMRAGVLDGDLVHVGELSFEWWRDDMASGLDRSHHRATQRERLARSGKLGDEDEANDQ